MKKILYYIIFAVLIGTTSGCTNLDEKVYSQLMTENYYTSRKDVIAAALRPFEHGSWTVAHRFTLNEQTTDQLGTWARDSWWVDNGVWQKLHYHTWDYEHSTVKEEWLYCYQGVMQINSVLDDFQTLDPVKLGMKESEFEDLTAQNRLLRCWFYIRLLDAYRNIPLAVSKDPSRNSIGQVSPETIFEFIEAEIKEALPLVKMKKGMGGNGIYQGAFNRATGAALLVRLYLNAEKWIGVPKYDECATIAQNIIDGKYGSYQLEDTWDKVFDWNNEKSDEIIMGFPSTYAGKHWHYDGKSSGVHVYWHCLPRFAHYYFGTTGQTGDNGLNNPKYGLQPSMDVEGNPYIFALGRPVAKFKKYPEDYRLKMYKNTGANKREGMMLYGYLEYTNDAGNIAKVISPTTNQPIYIRDQVGKFHQTPPGEIPANTKSDMTTGDHGSGYHFAKYPIYNDDSSGKLEADYAEIRLAEIYYSLAECKFRKGDIAGAGSLLNEVRKRNYPEEYHNDYLYKPEGKVELTQQELIDEWGREFLAEGRRRTDLCRWNLFSTSAWWDKAPDADNHTDIMAIHKDILNADPNLKQNPGYQSDAR